MLIQKGGCILVNAVGKIALIYRKKKQDYTFPKGHQERGENILECAIRETEEETGRVPHILPACPLPDLSYKTKSGNEALVHFFFALDAGESNLAVEDKLRHDLVWYDWEEVEKTVSYTYFQDYWRSVKQTVKQYIALQISP